MNVKLEELINKAVDAIEKGGSEFPALAKEMVEYNKYSIVMSLVQCSFVWLLLTGLWVFLVNYKVTSGSEVDVGGTQLLHTMSSAIYIAICFIVLMVFFDLVNNLIRNRIAPKFTVLTLLKELVTTEDSDE